MQLDRLPDDPRIQVLVGEFVEDHEERQEHRDQDRFDERRDHDRQHHAEQRADHRDQRGHARHQSDDHRVRQADDGGEDPDRDRYDQRDQQLPADEAAQDPVVVGGQLADQPLAALGKQGDDPPGELVAGMQEVRRDEQDEEQRGQRAEEPGHHRPGLADGVGSVVLDVHDQFVGPLLQVIVDLPVVEFLLQPRDTVVELLDVLRIIVRELLDLLGGRHADHRDERRHSQDHQRVDDQDRQAARHEPELREEVHRRQQRVGQQYRERHDQRDVSEFGKQPAGEVDDHSGGDDDQLDDEQSWQIDVHKSGFPETGSAPSIPHRSLWLGRK